MPRRHPTRFCRQPDYDNPRLVCGAPLPCPYHTIIIHAREQTVEEPVTARPGILAREVLKDLARAFREDRPARKGRKR